MVGAAHLILVDRVVQLFGRTHPSSFALLKLEYNL